MRRSARGGFAGVVVSAALAAGAAAGAQTVAVQAQTAPSAGAGAESAAGRLAAAQTQSAAACPDYAVERAAAGMEAVPAAALGVLAAHKFTLCPDRRLAGEMAVAWYPKVGVFAWRPGDPAVVHALAEIVDRLTRLDDFPAEVTVWNASDEELDAKGVPEFKLNETYRP